MLLSQRKRHFRKIATIRILSVVAWSKLIILPITKSKKLIILFLVSFRNFLSSVFPYFTLHYAVALYSSIIRFVYEYLSGEKLLRYLIAGVILILFSIYNGVGANWDFPKHHYSIISKKCLLTAGF